MTNRESNSPSADHPLSILAVLTCLLAITSGCTPQNEYAPPPPPEVTVARPVRESVTTYIEQTGETEAEEQAEVSARVRGFVEQIEFLPGQEVRKGETLYVIEKDLYEAARNAAVAEAAAADAAILVAKAYAKTVETEIERSELEFKRQQTLLETNATSQQDFDLAKSKRDTAIANLESAKASIVAAQAEKQRAEASIAQAELDLGYTVVKAPISGRISKTDVKRGNLVEIGDNLATIVDRKRIFANFNLSDRDALRLGKRAREEDPDETPSEELWRTIPVEMRTEIDEDFPYEGLLNYVDQEGVDAATGTLALRASFENPDEILVPGLFVHLRVPQSVQPDALLLPEAAVARDQRGTFVLVVNADRTVARQAVKTGPRSRGMIVIAEGLDADSRVVVEGLQRARPGVEVNPTEITIDRSDTDGSPQADSSPPANGGSPNTTSETAPAED